MTTENIKVLVERLAGKKPSRGGLPAASGRPAIGAATGFATPQTVASQSAATTGAIASPLSEGDIATREYYTERIYVSSDGFYTYKTRRIKALHFTDANGAEVVLNFADKP